jgi:hypothetical protein
MPHHRHSAVSVLPLLALASALLLAPARAQDTGIYRCGNTYGSTPCPGGQLIAADDDRTDAQRQQARAVQRQTAQQAEALADERRAREQIAAGQLAARIGPTEAERARAEAAAARKLVRDKAHDKAKKPKLTKARRLSQA